jgi:hypothetical protein
MFEQFNGIFRNATFTFRKVNYLNGLVQNISSLLKCEIDIEGEGEGEKRYLELGNYNFKG